MTFRRALLLGLCALFIGVAPAQAYLLPPEWIAEYMQKDRDKFDGLEVVQSIQVFDAKFADGKRAGKETVWLRKPSDFRLDGIYGAVKQTWINQGSQSIVVTDGQRTLDGAQNTLAFKDIFLAESGAALLRKLEAVGIDTKRVALGRAGAKVCYILGADEKTPDVPQLWIDKGIEKKGDKGAFRPYKLTYRDTIDGKPTLVSIVYDDFGRGGVSWYPGSVDVYFDKNLVASIRAERVNLRAGLGDEFFSLAEIRRKYAQGPAAGSTALSTSRVGETLAELKKRNP